MNVPPELARHAPRVYIFALLISSVSSIILAYITQARAFMFILEQIKERLIR